MPGKNARQNYLYFLFLAGILLLVIPCDLHAQLIPPQETEPEVVQPEWPEDSLGRRTPQGTISGFIRAVAEEDYEKAGKFLNMADAQVQGDGKELSLALEQFLDQNGQIYPYSRISTDPEGNLDDNLLQDKERVGNITVQGVTFDLILQDTSATDAPPLWLVSAETLEKIAAMKAYRESRLPVDRIVPSVMEKYKWGGVSIGQWLLVLLLAALSYFTVWALIRLFVRLLPWAFPSTGEQPSKGFIRAFSVPLRLYLAVWLFIYVSQETGISIIVRQRFSTVTLIVGILAFLILLWRLAEFIGRLSTRKMNRRGNISGLSVVLFLERATKIGIIIFGVIAILGSIGLDITTGLAAIGIGGIALALGAQKTIENFVGSVTVITDQPVRVGDFCKVGNTTGTVEKIGMRSTRIRTIERTLVTIPNGKFSSENIENYAHRDRFKFQAVLGLRYETTADQIRFLLVKLREVLYAHPMISPDPARVRFISVETQSYQLEVFAYITTKNFEEFLEVREDLLLQMMDIIKESGTDLALPSQTLYVGNDKGVSSEKQVQAEEQVRKWKENGELQLPEFDPKRIEELKGKTKYPPEGSAKQKNEGGTFPGLT